MLMGTYPYNFVSFGHCLGVCVGVCDGDMIQTFTFLRLWQLSLAVITAGSSPFSWICGVRLRL